MSELRSAIEATCGGSTIAEFEHRGELTIEVARERLVEVARFLRDAPLAFAMLSDLSCADYPDEDPRFRLAYQLFSIESGRRVRLRVWADANDPRVDSLVGVWPTANWFEREVYDLMGVRFNGHPDLARILMPEDWDGHPLRRDYPIGGEEVIFSDAV